MTCPNVLEENGLKYRACPECGGTGQIMTAKMYPMGHTECWEECDFESCDRGYIEEEDYLILKLMGRV